MTSGEMMYQVGPIYEQGCDLQEAGNNVNEKLPSCQAAEYLELFGGGQLPSPASTGKSG